jgi:hypothetical protein
VDTQGKFTTCRLDKSTDKFGKWRSNPNKLRQGSSPIWQKTYSQQKSHYAPKRDDSRWSQSGSSAGPKKIFRGLGKWYGTPRSASAGKKYR